MSERPRVALMAGMHRSGTSLMARIANLVGVDLGAPSRLMEPGRDNPAGYWENRSLRLIGEEVLEAFGGTWDVPPPLPTGWQHSPDLADVRELARQGLQRELPRSSGSGWAGWKDPRNSLLRPFWDTVREVDAVLVAIREPLAVARSLQHRNRMPLGDGLYLWLRYTLTAVLDSPGALIVEYGRAVSDPLSVASLIASHLELPEPTGDAAAAIEQHARPELQHHDSSPDASHPLVAYADSLYARLHTGHLSRSGAESIAVAEPIARGLFETHLSTEDVRELQSELGSVRTDLANSEQRAEGLERQRDSIRDHRDKLASELRARIRQIEMLHHDLEVMRRARDAHEDALQKAFRLVNEREAQIESMRESRDRWRERVILRS